ncbi:polyunsaturated fatty acid 5-lipoxygenase-like [Ischnura elegans]|uniref:polyunsaturated fatty acid 5-lipoxygenase-like n=1 Tax=Ischnura elegans TaxID=197161 RepID=UPI001ED88170|nr:polyunsaturated fatty acid 5-lipoxygenase-like [Ischnura elegans]
MGALMSMIFGKAQVEVFVTTGDRQGAGTDANVWLCIVDDLGNVTPDVLLDNLLQNDHERGQTYSYPIWKLGEMKGKVHKVVVWRDEAGIGDHWFLDRVEVEDRRRNTRHVFPLQRWVKPHVRYTMYEHHSFLPQHEPQLEMRREELEEKRKTFEYAARFNKGPLQVATLPADEAFSAKYMLDFLSLKGALMAQTMYLRLTTERWTSLEDLKNVYLENSQLYMPKVANMWMDDEWFGRQRVQGVNPVLITLCQEIPEKFGVTDEMVEPFLEGLTLEQALQKNKIFITDLEMLDGILCKDSGLPLVSPIALFYLNKAEDIMPLAIQLFQQKAPDNPVFLPSDPKYTWILAKMFYNMAEAQHHQSSTHLGLTHLLMEGICVCTHRHISPSHPLFKLLAPHFLYLLAINSRGLAKLIQPGGWVDTGMTVGIRGMFSLIEKSYLAWSFTKHGILPNEVKSRGVYDASILPYYPYRDDGEDLFLCIRKYVFNVVTHFYDDPDKIANDYELQAWREELVRPRSEGGLELQDVPGSNGRFETADEIAETMTVLVSTCSLGHAAANFQQYEAYGFIPNFPGKLTGAPPTDKQELGEADIMKYLPNKKETLDIMVITKLLSMKGTKSLGDFEVQYLYDPHSIQAAEEFRLDLRRLSHVIEERNLKRKHMYDWLNPKIVPNSISI